MHLAACARLSTCRGSHAAAHLWQVPLERLTSHLPCAPLPCVPLPLLTPPSTHITSAGAAGQRDAPGGGAAQRGGRGAAAGRDPEAAAAHLRAPSGQPHDHGAEPRGPGGLPQVGHAAAGCNICMWDCCGAGGRKARHCSAEPGGAGDFIVAALPPARRSLGREPVWVDLEAEPQINKDNPPDLKPVSY